jgi:hypothetical protein
MQIAPPASASSSPLRSRWRCLRAVIYTGRVADVSPYELLMDTRRSAAAAAAVVSLLEAIVSHVLLRAHAHRGDVQVKPTPYNTWLHANMYVYELR